MSRSEKPIELSIARFYPGRTASALLVPQTFSRKPEFTLNMEQVLVGTWDKFAGPYCTVNLLKVQETGNGLDVTLQGELEAIPIAPETLEPGLRLPYVLQLSLESEPYRVRIRGEMLELDYPLIAFTPCLYSLEFSRENHPPFEMAHKSFMYFEDQGFTWLSDAERTRSEWHRDPLVDDGGPWIQLFATQAFADIPAIARRTAHKEIASSPVVGWVADDDAYLIAVASRNAFQAGIRWGPCLHSDIACGAADQDRSFEMVVYALPVDLELLQEMAQEDFPDLAASAMRVHATALWPRTPGWLLNSFEDDDVHAWHVTEGTLGPYRSDRVWINGNLERVTYAEGYTEGRGAVLWEIPAGEGEAVLSGWVPLPSPRRGERVTHIALDALNRGPGETSVTLAVESKSQRLAQGRYRLRFWANRRLLLSLPANVQSSSLRVVVTVDKGDEPVRLVLDNLRAFHSGPGAQ